MQNDKGIGGFTAACSMEFRRPDEILVQKLICPSFYNSSIILPSLSRVFEWFEKF
jgi:hypothetical protein